MTGPKIALVTGGNKGIGFETCRRLAGQGWKVLLTARSEDKGRAACDRILAQGGDVLFHPLDVTRDEDVERIRAFVERELGRLDVLINNAAIAPELGKPPTQVDMATVRAVLETNLLAPWALSLAFIPLLKRSGGGQIIMISSGKGSFSKLAADHPAYRVSKTALNALTVVLADELRDSGVQVNAVTPGWVRTHLGGAQAPRSVEEGADGTVWLATLEGPLPTGKFFRDREEFPW